MLQINGEGKIFKITSENKKIFSGAAEEQVNNFVLFLRSIPLSALRKLSPQIQFLHFLYQYTLKLISKSAIIPQIIQTEKGAFSIRWIPAFFHFNIQSIETQLEDLFPEDFLYYKNQPLSKREQIRSMVSSIFFHLIGLVTHKMEGKKTSLDLMSFFFANEHLKFDSFSEQQQPQSIYKWLSKLFLSEKKHQIRIKVDEISEGFLMTPQIKMTKDQEPLSISEALTQVEQKDRLPLLSDLSILTDYLPDLEDALEKSENFILDLSEIKDFLFRIAPALQAIGLQVILPKSLTKIVTPRAQLHLKSSSKISDNTKNFLSLDTLVDFDWKIAIGEETLSLKQFETLLKKSKDLVKIHDKYVLLNQKEMEALLKKLEKMKTQDLSQMEIQQALLAEEWEESDVKFDAELRGLLESIQNTQPIEIPKNLKAQLRPYQERGVSWLLQNIHTGFGSILADDMGLGKTLQVLTTLLFLKNEGLLESEKKALIVAPTGLLSNWEKEFEKFTPHLKIALYYGKERSIPKDAEILLTSYGLVRQDSSIFQKKKWFLLVLDEAQAIKNPDAAQTKVIKSLKAQHKIAMSGTPVENRLLEYWSLFDFTNKKYLGTMKTFQSQYARPIEQERDQSCLNRFKKITAPFILRRLKTDRNIIADLPEKVEINQYCALTKEQSALYQEVVNLSIEKIQKSEGINRKGLIFSLITSLKQICNHPGQFDQTQTSYELSQSGKMQSLQKILKEIQEQGDKCLIFTQYVEMGKILMKLLSSSHPLFLYGGLSRADRDNILERFQNPHSQKKILILSLKAGGTGLNLTAAKHVIHYDLWWNPAVENQATDRAYRIGQNQKVLVHRLITKGTFEERINDLIQNKKELAEITVNTKETALTEMSTADLKNLVQLKSATSENEAISL